MRQSPPIGRKSGRDHTVHHPEITTTQLSEHGDAVNDRSEGTTAETKHWKEVRRRSDEGHVPFQRSATTRRQPSTSAIAVLNTTMSHERARPAAGPPAKDITSDSMVEGQNSRWRLRLRNPWACSPFTLVTTLLGFAVLFLMAQSFLTRQLDTKGCQMSYMRPIFHKFDDFDTEHTRFASKYSLYLYREGGIDDDERVCGRISGRRRKLMLCRLKECRCSSSPGTLAATSKCDRLELKQHTTITTL